MEANGTYSKKVNSLTSEQRIRLSEAYQASFDTLQEHLDVADATGKDVFTKEHVTWLIEPVTETQILFGEFSTDEVPWMIKSAMGKTRSGANETCLPDEFLKTWKPTFLIRHPALAFPSALRTSIDNEGLEAARAQKQIHKLEMTLHWSRGVV